MSLLIFEQVNTEEKTHLGIEKSWMIQNEMCSSNFEGSSHRLLFFFFNVLRLFNTELQSKIHFLTEPTAAATYDVTNSL